MLGLGRGTADRPPRVRYGRLRVLPAQALSCLYAAARCSASVKLNAKAGSVLVPASATTRRTAGPIRFPLTSYHLQPCFHLPFPGIRTRFL